MVNNVLARLLALPAALVLLQPVAATAQDSEWRAVGEGDAKKIYVKRSSMTRAGDIADAAVKENYLQPQPAGKKGKTDMSAKNKYRLDCRQNKVAYRKMIAYAQPDLQGEVVQEVAYKDKNLTWVDAVEGTMNGTLLRFVCSETAAAATP